MNRPLVIIESPYTHRHPMGIRMHEAYLELCIHNSIMKYGETPLATHKLYTKALDDQKAEERQRGMERLHDLSRISDYHVVYYDLGISSGMTWGIKAALKADKLVYFRTLYGANPRQNFSLQAWLSKLGEEQGKPYVFCWVSEMFDTVRLDVLPSEPVPTSEVHDEIPF